MQLPLPASFFFFCGKVPETGMYVVLVANCDPQTGTIVIGGHSEWKNPYGEDDAT